MEEKKNGAQVNMQEHDPLIDLSVLLRDMLHSFRQLPR